MSVPDAFTVDATDGAARACTLQTAHGPVQTPVFMPVGTLGTVKGVDPRELTEIGTQMLLGNTYHLHLRPGEELISELRQNYCIVIVTHSMQQAARVSQLTAFFHLGTLVEYGDTDEIFTAPQEKRTQDYITGRFG